MAVYTLLDKPLKVSGVPFYDTSKELVRLPNELIANLPQLERFGKCCPGGRIEFKTDSPSVTVKVIKRSTTEKEKDLMETEQSVQVMLGDRAKAKHLGAIVFPNSTTQVFENTFYKSKELEQITIYLPCDVAIENIEVAIEDGATITEPTPYKHKKPIVFYGSSITEGSKAHNSTNSISSILSRWLDVDSYNFGFSDNVMGELELADYINKIDMGAFVYEYEYEVPSFEHLSNTHKAFFDRIRKAHPDIPILIIARPEKVYDDEMNARREILKSTYNDAVANGDKKVFFIDGEAFFAETENGIFTFRNICYREDCYDSDLFLYRVACVIRPILKQMLYGTI